MKKNLIKFIGIILLILPGCADIQHDYVEADLKTYKAVAHDLVDYYSQEEDPLIRKLKLNTVKTWTVRLTEVLRNDGMEDLRESFTPVEVQ